MALGILHRTYKAVSDTSTETQGGLRQGQKCGHRQWKCKEEAPKICSVGRECVDEMIKAWEGSCYLNVHIQDEVFTWVRLELTDILQDNHLGRKHILKRGGDKHKTAKKR